MAEVQFSDAAQQTRVAISLCDRLGMTDALSASRRFLAREQYLGTFRRAEQVAANRVRAEALRELVTGTDDVAVSRVLEVLVATEPWLNADLEQGRMAAANTLLTEAMRTCLGQAFAALGAEGSALYQRVQKQAKVTVGEVAALPALGRKVWASPDPAHEAALEGSEGVWAAMVRAQDTFGLVHQLAAVLRSGGELGASALLPDGAPPWGYIYRRWDLALNAEQELKRLHSALRLRHAIDAKWEPGCWLASDLVRPKVERQQGPLGFLIPSGLKSAVGVK